MTTYTYTSPESQRIIAKMKAVIEEKQPILTRDLEIAMGICSSSVTRFAGHLRREGIAHSIKVKGSHAVAWVMGRLPQAGRHHLAPGAQGRQADGTPGQRQGCGGNSYDGSMDGRAVRTQGGTMTQMDFFGKGVAIFLCNLTMNMAQPWVDAGYRVVLVDPQHAASSVSGMVERIAGTVLDAMPRLSEIIRRERVVFVFGFPPCTDVAVSGARWFEEKRKADQHFQTRAALVAEQCRAVGMLAGCPWGFENPVSAFSSIFGRPQHTFDPHDFTGYCADDNYTKKTCLWTGGGFVMPVPLRDASLGVPDDRIHKAPPGDERANFRSATPRGFAMAAFLANRPDQ